MASQVFLSGSWNCQPSKPLETCQAAALNWSCQTKGSGKPSLSFRLLELPNYGLWQAKWYFSVAKLEAVASQVFLFLLARNCQMLLSNALKPSKPSKPLETCRQTRAVASQVFLSGSWNCQTTGSGKPSGFFRLPN